ncbi:uncharacterized protein I303_107221 [Kwoniella dejecticola CBS 10117]|uniref:Uncharacterized protein n=1 Tax=Kwoniella dejecticola CBS 10117 TaxID=1296121 RepID=A0A1A5ZZ23_9TREE|nr:uncharacterized protein I303_06622 [Kwoniella dejecticola CBS 10117]OBR83063.1 hypothetical protein I303_06622 [Kwoniella dejecticola CBS 10117]
MPPMDDSVNEASSASRYVVTEHDSRELADCKRRAKKLSERIERITMSTRAWTDLIHEEQGIIDDPETSPKDRRDSERRLQKHQALLQGALDQWHAIAEELASLNSALDTEEEKANKLGALYLSEGYGSHDGEAGSYSGQGGYQ